MQFHGKLQKTMKIQKKKKKRWKLLYGRVAFHRKMRRSGDFNRNRITLIQAIHRMVFEFCMVQTIKQTKIKKIRFKQLDVIHQAIYTQDTSQRSIQKLLVEKKSASKKMRNKKWLYLLFVDRQLYRLISEFRWEIGQISIWI